MSGFSFIGLGLVSLALSAGADLNRFAGTWAQDLKTSKPAVSAGTRMTFQQGPDGTVIVTRWSGDQPIRSVFRTDGSEQPLSAVPGTTGQWKKTGDKMFEVTLKRPGSAGSVQRHQLSDDGDTLTVIGTTTLRSGAASSTTSVYRRSAGDPNAVFGEWQRVSLQQNTPEVRHIRVNADGTITSLSADDATYTAKPGGPAVPYSGPTILPNITVSLRETGPDSIQQTFARDGKPLFINTMTVSQDGRTLTTEGREPDVSQAQSGSVYRKEPFAGFWKLDVEKSRCTFNPKLTPETQMVHPSEAGLRFLGRGATQSRTIDVHLDNKPREGRMPGRNPSGFDRIRSRRVSDANIETTYLSGEKPVGKSTLTVSDDGSTMTLHREVTADSKLHEDHFVYTR